MSTKNIAIIVVGVIVLVGLFMLLKPTNLNQYSEPVVQISEEKIFKLVVANKKLVQGEAVIRVTEGDKLVINVTSDTLDQLHLHGYDLSLDLTKNVEASLSFTASKTGRFEIELEKTHVEIGVLEVMPK